MSLSQSFSRIYEAWHRRADDDLQCWLDVWLEAFHLADFILDDFELATAVAHDAVIRIDEERPKRRHQLNNLAWYQSKESKEGRQVRLRKPLLPDHQFLDLLVYYFSTKREDEKLRRGDATLEDLDVWFIKSIFENSYWLRDRQQGAPAFRLMLGISGAIFNYDVYEEVPLIWEELLNAIPWRRELWIRGEEPFQLYWQKLLKRTRERFGSLLQRDGPDNLIRRKRSQQPDWLVWECLSRFELRDSNSLCLDKVTKIGNDNLAEIMRLHVITHRDCFARLVKRATLTGPEDRIGLPEYKVKNENSNATSRRGGSRLSQEQLSEVRDRLRRNLYRRKSVAAPSLVITLDDAEHHEASKELNELGLTTITMPDDVRLCQIWARSIKREDDVLLSALLVTHAARRSRIVLDSGEVLSLMVLSVAEDGDDSSQHILKVIYRKSVAARLLQALLPNSPRVTPLIEYPRLSLGLLSAAFILVGFFLLPLADPLIARLFPTPQPESRPALTNTLPPKDSAKGTPSPGSNIPAPVPGPTEVARGSHRDTTGRESPLRSTPNHNLLRPSTIKSLAEVDRIYVEKLDLFNVRLTNESVRSAEMAALDEDGVFRATSSRTDAQASLVLNTDYRSSGKRFVRPRLLLKNGSVLWEGPLIEINETTNSNDNQTIDGQQLTLLVEQLKAALRELRQAKVRDQVRP